MLLITTPTGHTGRSVVENVLRVGAPARLFVRDSSRLDPQVTELVAEVVEGDLHDEEALRHAAAGVKAAFFCVPQSGESADVSAYYASFVRPIARALQAAQVARVVTISGGRGNPDDIGPSGSLAQMEKTLDATGIHARHVRCGYFMENFLYTVPQLKYRGSFSLPLAPDYPLALMAAQDIGKTAASWLLDQTWIDQEGITVPYGQSLSCSQIASTLSHVLGKQIAFDAITTEEYKQMLLRFGLSEAMAQSLKEMFLDIENGSIGDSSGTKHSGGVSFAEWAQYHLKPAIESKDTE